VGKYVGAYVKTKFEGAYVGASVGAPVKIVGVYVGASVGEAVVGEYVGVAVGDFVGVAVGESVGVVVNTTEYLKHFPGLLRKGICLDHAFDLPALLRYNMQSLCLYSTASQVSNILHPIKQSYQLLSFLYNRISPPHTDALAALPWTFLKLSIFFGFEQVQIFVQKSLQVWYPNFASDLAAHNFAPLFLAVQESLHRFLVQPFSFPFRFTLQTILD